MSTTPFPGPRCPSRLQPAGCIWPSVPPLEWLLYFKWLSFSRLSHSCMAIKGSGAVTKCTWVPATVKYYYPLLLPSYLPNTGVLLYPRLALTSQQASYLSHHSSKIAGRSPSPSFVFLLTPLPVLIPQLHKRLKGKDVGLLLHPKPWKLFLPTDKKQRSFSTTYLKHRSHRQI